MAARDKTIQVVITVDGKRHAVEMDKATGKTRQFGNQGRKTAADVNHLTGAVKLFIGAIVAIKIGGLIKDATLLAARAETLGVVMETVGRNAGFTKSQVDAFAESVRAMGITTNVSRQIIIRMMQAQLDLNQASKLARVAQDAAVIGQVNSSEALDRLLHGVQTLQPEILRTIGITVTFEREYSEFAKTVGRTVESLTQAEKQQIAMNAVLREGEKITGTYEAAMGTAGKQLGSLDREFEELKRELGEAFLPTFTDLVVKTREWLPDLAILLERLGLIRREVSKFSLEQAIDLQVQMTRAVQNQARLVDSLVEGSPARAQAVERLNRLSERLQAANRRIEDLRRPPAPALPQVTKPDGGVVDTTRDEKIAAAFAKAELALQRQIELTGKQTHAERILFETKLGTFKGFEPAQKTTLVDMAKELDLKEQQIEREAERRQALRDEREAEGAMRAELIKQEQAALDQRREAAKQGLEIVRQSVSTELELADAKYAELHNKLVEAQRFERITIAEFNVLKQKLEEEHFDEVQRISKRTFDATRDQGKETFQELSQAVKGWGQDFADTLLDNEKGFAGFVDGVIRQLQRIAITKATDPLFGAFEKFLVEAFAPAAAGAGLGSQFTGTGFEGLQASGSFAQGGEFRVGGSPGIDRTLVAFQASRGERVKVSRPGEQSAGGGNVTVVMENRGTPQRVTGSEVSFDPNGMVVRIIKEDIQQGGGIAGTLESTYGFRRLGG